MTHSSRYQASRQRRGVLLLVVLTVLVLFMLMLVTYVLVATMAHATAKNNARRSRSGDSPFQMLDAAMLTMIRDTTDNLSPFRTHSLLETMYGTQLPIVTTSTANPPLTFFGHGFVGGQIRGGGETDPTYPAGGQFETFCPVCTAVYNNGTVQMIAGSSAGTNSFAFNAAPNYYKGCVVTMLSGICVGTSSRVVGSGLNSSGAPSLTVMAISADVGGVTQAGDPIYVPSFSSPVPGQPNVATLGDIFMINNRPYTGLGRGYNLTTAQNMNNPGVSTPANDAVDPSMATVVPSGALYALFPNSAAFSPDMTPVSGSNPTPRYADPAGPGGAGVDYTAYDLQNFYLGLITNGNATNPILPSFHRSELIKYWITKQGTGNFAGLPLQLQRKILLRPNPQDAPIFCQTTNPNLSQNPDDQTVPLDVDNLGTGVPDSVWIDPGWPAMTSPDGRTYKIMVAALILDLDGRFNVNAHGSYTQLDRNGPYQTSGGVGGLESVNSLSLAGSGGAQFPIGMAVGPADINPLAGTPPLFSNVPGGGDFTSLLSGGNGWQPPAPGLQWQGRYGGPTATGGVLPVSPTAHTALTALKLFQYPPTDYRDTPLTSFGSPSDLKGRRMVGIDWRGQPIWLTSAAAPGTTNATDPSNDALNGGDTNAGWKNEIFDSSSPPAYTAYGFDLGTRLPRPGRAAPAGLDNPYTVAELERLLRLPDVDIALRNAATVGFTACCRYSIRAIRVTTRCAGSSLRPTVGMLLRQIWCRRAICARSLARSAIARIRLPIWSVPA